jgi:hypothetical protein
VLIATHDSHMVDRMRRRVIELRGGQIIRDEERGMYKQGDQTTAEFGDMLDRAYGQLGRDQPTGDFRAVDERGHDAASHHLWTPDEPHRPDPPAGRGFSNY